MAALKLKGDQAEIEVARDLIRRGFRIAIPYGEDWNFDYAEDYLHPEPRPQLSVEVEPAGLEPAPFRMQTERSSN
jgi:hypothetical protein